MSDPSSIVLSVASKSVGFLLGSIIKIAKEIREISKRTKANKYQCSRLSQRINNLVSFLQRQTFDDKVDESIKFALVNFAMFLQSCVEFMNKFTNAGFLKRLWNNKDDLNRFNELETECSQHVSDLTLGIISIAMFGNKNKDQQYQQYKSIQILQLTSMKSDQNNECNSLSVTSNESDHLKYQDQTENIFVSNVWKYRYSFDETWQHLSHFHLMFDIENETFLGYVDDQLGRFRLNGSLCTRSQTIEMIWLYRDEKLNVEHKKVIELQWDNDRKSFRGTFKLNQKSEDETDLSSGQFEMCLLTPLS